MPTTTAPTVPSPACAWTPQDVATFLQTDVKTVRVLMGQEDFPKPKWLGKRRPRWAPTLVAAWLEEGGSLAAPEPARQARRQIVDRV